MLSASCLYSLTAPLVKGHEALRLPSWQWGPTGGCSVTSVGKILQMHHWHFFFKFSVLWNFMKPVYHKSLNNWLFNDCQTSITVCCCSYKITQENVQLPHNFYIHSVLTTITSGQSRTQPGKVMFSLLICAFLLCTCVRWIAEWLIFSRRYFSKHQLPCHDPHCKFQLLTASAE